MSNDVTLDKEVNKMKIETYGKATIFQKIERAIKQKKGYGTMLIPVTNDWNNDF